MAALSGQQGLEVVALVRTGDQGSAGDPSWWASLASQPPSTVLAPFPLAVAEFLPFWLSSTNRFSHSLFFLVEVEAGHRPPAVYLL